MKTSINQILLAAFAMVAFNQSVQAGILLEPYLGYVSGKIKATTDANYKGTELGARVGYSLLDFAVGAEYAMTNFTDDSSPSVDIKGADLGIFASFKFPILVRAYATYFPSPEAKNSSGGISTTSKSGNITKLGVGFTGFPFINVNFEYITGSFSKAEAGGVEVPFDLKTTAYAISVSAPFDLL